jgi:hypothetical protein
VEKVLTLLWFFGFTWIDLGGSDNGTGLHINDPLPIMSPTRMGGNIMFSPQIIIFLCVILSNSLLKIPYKQFAYVTKIEIFSNISHAPITHRIDKISMASYYGVESKSQKIQRSLLVITTTAKTPKHTDLLATK